MAEACAHFLLPQARSRAGRARVEPPGPPVSGPEGHSCLLSILHLFLFALLLL